MTREEYINYRSNNNPDPLYEMYKEGYNEKKHSRFLSKGDFFQNIQMWPPALQALQDTYHYYDAHFNVLIVRDKQGNVLKFV